MLTRCAAAIGQIFQGKASDGIQPGPDNRAHQERRLGEGAIVEGAGLEAELNGEKNVGNWLVD